MLRECLFICLQISIYANKIINMIHLILMTTRENKWLPIASLLSFVEREKQNSAFPYSTGHSAHLTYFYPDASMWGRQLCLLLINMQYLKYSIVQFSLHSTKVPAGGLTQVSSLLTFWQDIVVYKWLVVRLQLSWDISSSWAADGRA